MQPVISWLRRGRNLYFFSAGVSLLFSWLAVYADPLANKDGILYLIIAETYVEEGFQNASQYYFWPFYSILIGSFHQLTQLPYLLSARIINALLLAFMVVIFIALAKESLRSKSAGLWAAAVILLCPAINELRHYIVRDFGFWAFFLCANYFLLKFVRGLRLRDATAASACMLISGIFRPEGVLLALAMSFVTVFIGPMAGKARRSLELLVVPAAFFLLGTLVLLFDEQLAINKLYYSAIEFYQQRIIAGFDEFNHLVEIYSAEVLGKYSTEFAPISLIAGLIALLFATVLDSFGPAYIIITLYAFTRLRPQIDPDARVILLYMLALCMAMLFVVLLAIQYLLQRYTVTPVLVGLFFATAAVTALYNHSIIHNRKSQFQRWAITIALLLFMDSFISLGASKNHHLQSAQWLRENTAEDATLFSNNNIIAYYSERAFDYNQHYRNQRMIYHKNAPLDKDYWVVEMRKRDEKRLTPALAQYQDQLKPLAEFHNRKNNRVFIYQVLAIPSATENKDSKDTHETDTMEGSPPLLNQRRAESPEPLSNDQLLSH